MTRRYAVILFSLMLLLPVIVVRHEPALSVATYSCSSSNIPSSTCWDNEYTNNWHIYVSAGGVCGNGRSVTVSGSVAANCRNPAYGDVFAGRDTYDAPFLTSAGWAYIPVGGLRATAHGESAEGMHWDSFEESYCDGAYDSYYDPTVPC